MKMIKNILLAFSALALAFMSAACSDINSPKEASQNSAGKAIVVNGSLSAGSGRSAISSYTSDTITWDVTACPMTEDGSPNTDNIVEATVNEDMSFSITFTKEGDYLFFAKGTIDGKSVLVGNAIANIKDGTNTVTITVSSPFEVETGKISLAFTDATQDSLLAKLSVYENAELVSTDKFTDGSAHFEMAESTAGLHIYKFCFDDQAGNTIYTCREAVTVFGGLTTDTWQGKSPYFVQDEDGSVRFEINDDLITGYDAERVPNTKIVLYRNVKTTDDGDRRIDYYLTDDASMLITDNTAATVATAEGSPDFTFVFDSKGNVYTLAKRLDSASYIKSTNTDFGKETFNNSILPNSMYLYGDNGRTLVMDRVNDVLYIYDDNSNTLTQIASDDGTYDYDGAAGIYYFAKTYSFSEDDNSNTMRNNSALTIVDKIVYFAATEEDYDEEIEKSIAYIKLVIADLNNATQGGGTNSYEYTGSKLVSINLAEMGLSNQAEVNDILYQDGCIYMLVTDKYESFSAQLDDEGDPTDVIEGEIINRGTVVKYDLISGETAHLPFETTATSQQKLYPIGGTSSGDYYRLYNRNYNYEEPTASTYTPVLYDVTGHTGAKIDVYSHISENTSSKVLYSPKKFAAIRPKKLIIADDGIAYYVDSLGGLRYKNENRVVEVDLESFAISKVEVATVAFSEDITGDIVISSAVMGEAFSHGTQYFYNPESDSKDENGYVASTSEIGNFFPGILSEED